MKHERRSEALGAIHETILPCSVHPLATRFHQDIGEHNRADEKLTKSSEAMSYEEGVEALFEGVGFAHSSACRIAFILAKLGRCVASTAGLSSASTVKERLPLV